MVRSLLAAGWELAAHSLTHADLTTLDAAGLRREVAGSRSELRRRFGVSPRFFCYPSGRYDAARVRRRSPVRASTARPQSSPGWRRPDRPFELRRVRIDGGDGARGLAVKLASLGRPTDLTAVHGGLGSR